MVRHIPARNLLKNIRWAFLLCVWTLALCAALPSAQNPPSDTNQVSEHLKSGDASLKKSDWDSALREYREAVQLDPENVPAHNGVGRALGEKGDHDGALREFQEAVRLDPNYAEAHNGMGWILGLKGDIDGAMKEYREAIRLKPEYARAHSNLGWAFTEKEDWDNAIREYREAVRLKPDDTDAYDGLAWSLNQKGDWPSALREYREAIRLKPNDLDPHLALGAAYMNKGDFDSALREYREAVRVKPDSAQAHASVGVALSRKGDWKTATAEDREAVRLDPNYADGHADLAFDLGHSGDWDGEIREARESVRLQPSRALAHYYLGRGLEHKGDRKAALAEYGKASKLDPKNQSIAANYDRLQTELNLLPGNWSPATLRAFTISAALVPSFLLLGYFRARDLFPEPARALWGTFAFGAVIVFPVLLLDWPLSHIVSYFHGAIAHGFAEALFTAALPEELLKFAVVMLFCVRLKAFNEPMDGIVYGAVASLGFATLENVGYVAENGIGVAVSRAFTSVPGHAFMGAVMGYFVGQWRFGPAAGRGWTLLKAYVVPVSLHWMYDFPLLAYGAANRLPGPAKQAAVAEIQPIMFLTVAILILESIWGVRLVNRLRREQIQLARDAVAVAAAEEGAMDIVALVKAPDAPPSAWPGWLMTLFGGLIATCGGFVTLFVMIYFIETRAHGNADIDLFGGSILGGIPLLIGLVMFVYGVQRIHASNRGVADPSLPAAARA